MDCRCLRPAIAAAQEPVEALAAIRSECAALHELFLPDPVWPQFQSWHRNPDNVAHHRSVLLLALERGHLGRVTSPIHRYLLADGCVRPDVRRQYRKCLRECWMYCDHPIERHQESRRFRGLVTELQCAEWLETLGWVITGLEALREGPDIEASRDGGSVMESFEVKFIGTQDDDFRMILQSLAGEPAAEAVSPYTAINFLLFRVYEAAKQLIRLSQRKIAVIVIEDLTWWRFSFQLKNDWIDWKKPQLVGADPDWEEFLRKQHCRYPALLSELPSVIAQLDSVWIVRQLEGHCFQLEYEIPIRA